MASLVKGSCSQNCSSQTAGNAILSLANLSLRFLNSQCSIADLVSRVPGKSYISYTINNVVTRPVNCGLCIKEEDIITQFWRSWINGNINENDFACMSYTVALAPCLAMELFDRGNKKGPATYFECYIGYTFARTLGVNPEKRASLPVLGRRVLMTMDFIFDIGTKKYIFL
jgi:hypothetical protein